MKTYVVADLAGRYTEFLKLIEQFEKPHNLVLVGDIIDRGSESKELVEYLMSHPEIVCLFGNHEWLMLEARNEWLYNGGHATLNSFGGTIPEEVLEWVRKLPRRHEVEVDGKLYLITHAPVPDPERPWLEKPQELWNRYEPKRDPKYTLQIYGHNSRLEWVADNEGTYAVCIDDCRAKHLTAIELPSLKLFHQPYKEWVPAK